VAFLITAAACFSLTCFVCPLTVTGFESTTSVTVDFESIDFEKQEFLNVLAETLRHQMSESQLDELIAETRSASGSAALIPGQLELETVQHSLAVRHIDSQIPNQLSLEFRFEGLGNQSERNLVALFAERCCQALERGIESNPNQLTAKIQSPRWREFDEAATGLSNTINGLKREIEDIATKLALQDSNAELVSELRYRVIGSQLDTPSGSAREDSSFRVVSMSRKKSLPAASSQWQLAEDGDQIGKISALRQGLQTLKNTPLPQQVGGANSLTASSLSTPLVTQPIGGAPSHAQFLLMGLFSSIVGLVVAQHYNPFRATGFDSVGSLASVLGLPVVATLPSRRSRRSSQTASHESHESAVSNWRESAANHAYWLLKSMLFGMLIVVAGFCLVNEEVRVAFLNNPFHGLAKMVWTFIGY
jgi:hypothetical protein